MIHLFKLIGILILFIIVAAIARKMIDSKYAFIEISGIILFILCLIGIAGTCIVLKMTRIVL